MDAFVSGVKNTYINSTKISFEDKIFGLNN